MYGLIALYLLIPYAATVAGVIAATFLKNPSKQTERIMLGFAAGVMLAASVWGLLIPAFEYAEGNSLMLLWISGGFLAGIGFILALDMLLPHLHPNAKSPEGMKSDLPRSLLLVFAVALHNIPEGLAMGVVIGAALYGDVSAGAAIAMSAGLALQNFPEGLAVTFPLIREGVGRRKSFWFGQISGAAEPLFAVLGIFIATSLSEYLPVLLAVAAGAMFFVIVEELIPESQSSDSHAGTYGLLGGFWVMAVMAVWLG